MLRRVTELVAVGGDSGRVVVAFPADAITVRRRHARSFTEFGPRRHSRSSACAGLVGLAWSFDPPATIQQDSDRLEPYSFDPKSLDA
jgi:hypothetical protein